MTKSLYVGNLPWSATEDDVRDLFAPYGEVTSVKLVSDRETGRARGFGFVEMASEGVQAAVEALDNFSFSGNAEAKRTAVGTTYMGLTAEDFVNKSAMNGTILAHTDGSVPNLMVKIPAQDAYSLGQLFYFFEFACGVSGYILGVNPFNQPGVESYKKNMFALLGKPGYEEAREALLKRL